MKNLVSKLFGGLAIAAFVFGSFTTSSVQAATTVDNLQVQDVNVEEVAVADWYVIIGSEYALVVKK